MNVLLQGDKAELKPWWEPQDRASCERVALGRAACAMGEVIGRVTLDRPAPPSLYGGDNWRAARDWGDAVASYLRLALYFWLLGVVERLEDRKP